MTKYTPTIDKPARRLQQQIARLGTLELVAAADDYFRCCAAKRGGRPIRPERVSRLLLNIAEMRAAYGDAATASALRDAICDDTRWMQTPGGPTENPARLRQLAAEAVTR